MRTLKKKQIKLKNTIKLKRLNTNYKKSIMKGGDYKQDYIEILKQLEYYNRKYEKQQFKAKIYRESIEQIKNLNKELESSNDIKNLPGIGKAVIEKLDEFIKDGKVNNLEKLKEKYGTEEYEKEKIRQEKKEVFLKIHGIGDAAAEKILEMGITTIEELKKRKDEEIPGKGKKKLKLLNETQQKGLEYYEDILKRIPRQEVDKYKLEINKLFLELLKNNNSNEEDNKLEIVGSYRRGKTDSGDIDIIITSKIDDNTIFNNLLDKLKEKGLIKVFLSRGEKKSMVIGKLNEESTARRLDFLYTSPDEYAFAILYFTGSKDFNTAMRQHALKNELTLNEHGFHKMKNKIKGDKITSTKFDTEKDIFDYLNLEFKEPQERIDENSIIIKSKKEEPKKEEPKKDEPKKGQKTMKVKIPKSNAETLKKMGKKAKIKIISDNVEKFKSQGATILESLSEEELTEILKYSNQKYYAEDEESLLTDNEYDILREYVLKKYPNNETAKKQHGDLEITSDKNKVKLPYEMWSMDKIKPDTKELEKFKKKYSGPYVISCKLDGVSALYSTEENEPKLYTRGDGKIGQSIDHLIPYLKLPTEKNITLRGEIIIKENLFKEKYSNKYSNSRNFIAGLVNKKKLNNNDINMLKDIDFVGYEVIKPENLKPSEQLNKIIELKKICVKFLENITSTQLTNEFLSEKLVDWRSNYEYTIDGIICCNDKVYSRQSKNPDHCFAFKMVLSDQAAEAKVLDVIWAASKDGYLKPRVQIEQVNIGGANINYATGFNAKFIKDNKIGLGAVIKIIRSGDVIPKIEEVITPAEIPLMPKEEYIWNETNVDIMLVNKDTDETVKLKTITGFFKALEVDGLGEGNVKKIIKAGGNTIGKIIGMNIDDLLKVEGFQIKKATKIYNSIQDKIKESSLARIAAASNIFGRGFAEKKINLILDTEPKIITEETTEEEKIKKLKNIEGLADKTARAFVKKIPEFLKFIEEAKLEDKLKEKLTVKQPELPKNLPLSNKIIVLSDVVGKKEIGEKIKEQGGEVIGNINRTVNLLIVGDINTETGKMKKARDYKIEIISIDDFKKKYNLE